MGVIAFWTAFLILCILLVVSGMSRKNTAVREKKKRILGLFDTNEDLLYDSDAFDDIPSYFYHLKESDPGLFCVDDTTVNDLGLRDIYERLNRCETNAGADLLYSKLRLLQKEAGPDPEFYDGIKTFIEEPEKAADIKFILSSKFGRYKNTDVFSLITELADAKTKSVLPDIAAGILLVLAVMLCFVRPLAGVAAVIIVAAFNVFTYFRGKSEMDSNLKGLAAFFRMIRCALALSLDGFSHLYPLTSFDFLIPFRDGTTSNPLSIIYDYVKMLTHIDLIVYRIKIGKIQAYTDDAVKLYGRMGELDVQTALASYLIHKKHCRSAVSDEYIIDAKQIYHPLVKREPVCNDLTAKRGVIITGSNASGKSTFLKAVAVNVIFTESFGFAFASSFVCGRFSLYTSMALNDDLLGGESYYIVEARSIKRICDAAKNEGCLCIIDEVLRGTNVIERIAASTKILEFLCRPNVICFAATHDLELAQLMASAMDRYYFEDSITGTDVSFPFVIKEGVTASTNAIRLLDMLGFEKEIVEGAEKLAGNYKKTGNFTGEA